MNGTEWTEPGQGATAGQLWSATFNSDAGGTHHEKAITRGWLNYRESFGIRTNLRLTGAPLNEYDLRRIAECK